MSVSGDIQFRRHTRLRGFDYRQSFAYFVTICTRDRQCVFGTVANDAVSLTRRGMIARDCWLDIPNHHPHVELDEFIIMPNHVHGILLFVGDAPGMSSVVATPASRPSLATGPERGSLGAVIGSFKSAVTRTINRLLPGVGTALWQANYYDHILRNDHARDRVREYIQLNPQRWMQDAENPEGDGTDVLEVFLRSLDDSPLRGDRDATSDRDAGVATTDEGKPRD
jgi:REP element-mobilizing transposase RayT